MQKSTKNLLIIITSAVITGTVFAFAKRRVEPKGKTALFVGDSHTALFGNGWQDTLAKLYGFSVVNIAKSGIQTSQMLSSLTTYLNSKPTPDLLFIYGGANDIYGKVAASTVFKNIQAMVDLGIDKGIKPSNIFVITGYRTSKVTKGSKYAQGGFPERMDAVKETMNTQVKRATVVPIWEGGTSADTGDGLHLNSKAQARFAQHIGSKIFK